MADNGGRLDNLISHSDNLDEQISVVEFIKTLKKADSTNDFVNGKEKSGESSKSTSQEGVCKSGDDEKRKLTDKRSSASELLSNMRRRFVHRATEPVFSHLETKQGECEDPCASRGNGSDNALRMPQMETSSFLFRDRMTDSEPALSIANSKKNHKF